MTNARRLGLFLLAGSAWGALSYVLGREWYGEIIWAGIIASPLIGLAVGQLAQSAFDRARPGRRVLIALGSLCAAATLYGTVIGALNWHLRAPGSPGVEAFWEGLASAWYGAAMLGIGLWPLAYWTHHLIGRLSARPSVATSRTTSLG